MSTTSFPGDYLRGISAITLSWRTKGVTRASRTCSRQRSIWNVGPSAIVPAEVN